jgi:lambda repressor-like predicted transcriptional regulator
MHPENIKCSLKKSGATQADIARALHIKQPSVAAVIEGRARSRRVEDLISQVTGVALARLWPRWYSTEAHPSSPVIEPSNTPTRCADTAPHPKHTKPKQGIHVSEAPGATEARVGSATNQGVIQKRSDSHEAQDQSGSKRSSKRRRASSGVSSVRTGEVLLDRATAERARVSDRKFHPVQANCATAKPGEDWTCPVCGAASNA